jgi:ribose 5-phosphate isomerase B
LPSATAQRLRRIGIGADHRGYKLKEKLKFFLVMQGYKVNDYGVFSEDRADYPKIAIELAHHLKTTPKPKSPKIDWGILICSTGVGMSIAANKVKGIRAALCLSPEFAQRARQHNNANVLVLAGDFTSPKKAQEIVKVFLSESFLKGRYRKRTNQIAKYEKS